MHIAGKGKLMANLTGLEKLEIIRYIEADKPHRPREPVFSKISPALTLWARRLPDE